jgi:hypothetical protein
MLEARIKQLQNQVRRDFSFNKSLNASLVPLPEEGGDREGGGQEGGR